MTEPHIVHTLAMELGLCAGGVGSILEPKYKLPPVGLDNAIMENYAFLLAFLSMNQALSSEECGELTACFVGVNVGNNTEAFVAIAKAIQFYYKHLKMIEHRPSDIYAISVMLCNLLHPRTLKESINLDSAIELSVPEMVELWMKLQDFLTNILPQRVNPILDKMK